MSLLEKHVFDDGDGEAVFLFNPEKYTSKVEGSVQIVVNQDIKVINFLALMDELGLERNAQNAEALVIALLEKAGSQEVAEYA